MSRGGLETGNGTSHTGRWEERGGGATAGEMGNWQAKQNSAKDGVFNVVLPLSCAAIFWLGVPKFGIQITRTLLKKSSISAESSRRDTSKSEVFSVLGALACTHDLLKVRPKCHYGVFFAQHFSLAKAITLANLTMHIYEVWPAGTPKY